MAWMYLLLAAACEMVWPLGFKFTNGFREKYWAVGVTFGVMILSFYLLSLATRGGIAVGTAYAIWTGLGAAGVTIIGIIVFDEPRDAARLACIGLIIAGVVGVKLFTPKENGAPAAPARVQ